MCTSAKHVARPFHPSKHLEGTAPATRSLRIKMKITATPTRADQVISFKALFPPPTQTPTPTGRIITITVILCIHLTMRIHHLKWRGMSIITIATTYPLPHRYHFSSQIEPYTMVLPTIRAAIRVEFMSAPFVGLSSHQARPWVAI